MAPKRMQVQGFERAEPLSCLPLARSLGARAKLESLTAIKVNWYKNWWGRTLAHIIPHNDPSWTRAKTSDDSDWHGWSSYSMSDTWLKHNLSERQRKTLYISFHHSALTLARPSLFFAHSTEYKIVVVVIQRISFDASSSATFLSRKFLVLFSKFLQRKIELSRSKKFPF